MEKPARILVVDDDEANRESLRRRLERRGYTLTVAADGTEALRLLEQPSFDLVILDVMMPGVSGLEVLDRVRTTTSPTQLPIIMATARSDSADIVEAMRRGANDYVTKPLDFEVVAARVKTQLGLKLAVDEIERLTTDLAAQNAALETANAQLLDNVHRRDRELAAAAQVQRAFLPKPDPNIEGARFAWLFEPCYELAGDSLNVVALDKDHVAFYVLDVSGHGVGASLLAVTATRLLSAYGDVDAIVYRDTGAGALEPAEPAEVVTRLAQRFSMETTGNFITLFYAVLNLRTRELTFVSAGHPPAMRVRADRQIVELHGSAMPIGIEQPFTQERVTLAPGERLYLYSDGVTEAMDDEDRLFGQERLLEALKVGADQTLARSITLVGEALAVWRGPSQSRDDVTILGMECV